jgi:hypothetical protein
MVHYTEYFIKMKILFLFKQYLIHIQSEWDQAAGLSYFSPLPTPKGQV